MRKIKPLNAQQKSILSLACLLISSGVSASQEWAGSYFGVNGGGYWGQSQITTTMPNSGYFNIFAQETASKLSGTVYPGGFIGGLQGGYNWQFNTVMFGIESDINSISVDNTLYSNSQYIPGDPGSTRWVGTENIESNWLFTLRPRIGYSINKFLIYFTGGLTVNDLSVKNIFSDGSYYSYSRVSQVQYGWTAGLGTEYKLKGKWTDWSVKLEYLYANLGNISSTAVGSRVEGVSTDNQAMNYNYDLNLNIIRLGINYHF